MKIASFEMQMHSSHVLLQREEMQASMRTRTAAGGAPPVHAAAVPRSPLPSEADTVTFSAAGQAAQAADAGVVAPAEAAVESDPQLQLLRSIIFLLTGEEARVFDAASLSPAAAGGGASAAATAAPPAQSAPAPAAEYSFRSSRTEIEQTALAASGVVRTTDGREISFQLELSMSRVYHQEAEGSVRFGEAERPRKDPLVLNFAGTAAQLREQRFRFDLDADGRAEEINQLAGGSGFLALDRNGDGRINNGSELFGARSGDGFAELALLDDDGNGWLDENDAAFSQLRVWTPAADGGGALQTLRQNGIGALGLARAATPFDVRDAANQTLAQVRSSGVFLYESGGVGSMQQIDLSV